MPNGARQHIIMNVTRVAFLLHLYQPSVQDPAVFREIFETCYSPLLKLIKQKRNLKITLNVPLSLLEQMEQYGYLSWIENLKEFYNTERIELTGCAAYHPLLTKIPEKLAEQQIVLNEYGLGYYLGRKTGFEGEPSIMLKDIRGFFPPEMAVNDNLLNLLNTLGYSWMIADETSVDQGPGIYNVRDFDTKVVVRNRALSNAISFKRDSNIEDIIKYINDRNFNLIALDGEVFGHHSKEGLLFLGTLIDRLEALNYQTTTISEFIDYNESKNFSSLKESTWGASDEEITSGDIYPYWVNQSNDLQKFQWELFDDILSNTLYLYDFDLKATSEDMTTFPIWKNDSLETLADDALKECLRNRIVLSKAVSSDCFWWLSNKTGYMGAKFFSSDIVKKYLNLYETIAEGIEDAKKRDDIIKKIEKQKAALS